MKKKVIALLAVVVLLCMGLSVPVSAAGDARLEAFGIDAQIQKDGSMNLAYDLSYQFTSDINGVYLSLTGNEFTVSDLTLSEKKPDGSYQTFEQRSGAASGDSGVYSKEENSDEIKIFRPGKKNENVQLRVVFRVENVAKRGVDTASLYYFFVGKNWEIPIRTLSINVTLPEGAGASAEKNRVYVHSDADGAKEVLDARTIRVTAENLKAGEHLEARLLFPAELLDDTVTEEDITFAGVVSEEEAFLQKTQELREEAKRKLLLTSVIAGTASAAGLCLFLVFLIQYKRKPKVSGDTKQYLWELPEQISPAQLAWLWRKMNLNEDAITATLLYLKNKGYLTIEPLEPAKNGDEDMKFIRTDKPWDELSSHERNLLKWFIELIGDGTSVTLSDIRVYSKNPSSAAAFSQSYEHWKEMVKKDSEPLGYYKPMFHGLRRATIIAGGLLVAVGIFTLFLGGVAGMLPIVLGGVMIVCPLFIVSRTQKGEESYQNWLALRRYLVDYAHLDEKEAAFNVAWEQFLPYAIVMGAADPVSEQMKLQSKRIEDWERSNPNQRYPYYYGDRYLYGYSAFWMGTGVMHHTMRSALYNSQHVVSSISSSNGLGSGSGGFSGGSFGGGGGGAGGGGGTF